MDDAVDILITGDFYAGNRIEYCILKNEYDQIFNDFLPLIRNSDIAITNLEAPLIKKGNSIKKTGPAIKAIPKTVEAIKHAGFNLLSLANNHILDYGIEGLRNTINICAKNQIDILGVGGNFQEASQTLFKQINNIKIAFLNFCENEWSTTTDSNPGAHPLNPISNYYKIKEAKKSADFVIVIVHGGHEMYNLPSPRMKETYRFFVNVGADIVVGHHTHCYSGYENYNEGTIFYSLGNFVFDTIHQKHENWYSGFGISLKISKYARPEFKIHPYVQCKEKVGVKLLEEKEEFDFLKNLETLNNIIQDDELLISHFNNFVNDEVAMTYKSLIEPHSLRPIRLLQRLSILPSILTQKKRKLYLNLIRCEAHRDVVIKLLNNDSNT